MAQISLNWGDSWATSSLVGEASRQVFSGKGYIFIQSNLFIPRFDIMTKFVITTIWMERFFSSRWGRLLEISMNTLFNTARNICCGYLLESPHQGDSNKYPQHMFLGVNKGKKAFYHLSYWYVGILYSDKFIS